MEEMRLKENQELRDRLDKLLRQARQNEPVQSSFDDFALSVMAAQGPQELFSLLLDKQKKYRIDEIRLFIMDRFHEIERLLTENYQPRYSGLIFIDSESCKLLI